MVPIRVLVVDDSGLMRIWLTDLLSQDEEIKVLDSAINGKEAAEKNLTLQPDVIVLDMFMGEFDGFYAIKRIMTERKVPIVVLSSGADSDDLFVEKILEAGAHSFLHKPRSLVSPILDEIRLCLIDHIKIAASSGMGVGKPVRAYQPSFLAHKPRYRAVVIGSSTGGTSTIEQIFQRLPVLPIPIIVAQHIAAGFVLSFVERLRRLTHWKIEFADEGKKLKAETVYMLRADTNTYLSRTTEHEIAFAYTDEQFPEYNYPSINCLFLSAAHVYASECIGLILSGMGKDGVLGLKEIHKQGGLTIAQDERTSLVNGMPKAAIQSGAVDKIISSAQMPSLLLKSCFPEAT
jgi:two-component system, chemotaxis family, protein-glutamate methylesterase/glutaminase